MLMEVAPRNGEQEQNQEIKCPRCGSSNTKFCYYNNYSLSQPRHFCKSCRRYWTRGGTLRNVPVGGGCRKNKRIKRSSPPVKLETDQGGDQIGSVSGSNLPNQFFYGLPTNPNYVDDLSHTAGIIPKVSSSMGCFSGFDPYPQLSAFALELSSGFMSSVFNPISCSNSLLSGHSLLSLPCSASSISSSMSTFLDSSIHHKPKPMEGERYSHDSQFVKPLRNINVDQKEEANQDHKNLFWNQLDIVGSFDPSIYWSNNSTIASFLDPENMGSSFF